MKHATEVGGSNVAQYMGCTGAKELELHLKNGGEGPAGLSILASANGNKDAANEGTALHSIMEDCITSEEPIEPEDYIDQEIAIDDDDKEIWVPIEEKHILKKGRPALDFFDEHLGDGDYWPEVKVEMPQDTLPGCWGTADGLFHHPKIGAGLWDWKFGKHKRRADDPQFKFYLTCAVNLEWFLADYDKFTVFVIQPLDGEVKLESATYALGQLDDFEDELIEAYNKHQDLRKLIATDAKAIKDPIHFNEGGHCQYCKVKVLCPKKQAHGRAFSMQFNSVHAEAPPRTKVVDTVKKVVDGGIDLKELYSHFDSVPADAPKKVVDGGTDLKELYLEACRVAAWVDAVKKYVKTEFDGGRPVLGLRKEVSQTEQKWIDNQKGLNWTRRQKKANGEKITADEYYGPREVRTPAQIKKVLGVDIPEKVAPRVPRGYRYVEDTLPAAPQIEAQQTAEQPAKEDDQPLTVNEIENLLS